MAAILGGSTRGRFGVPRPAADVEQRRAVDAVDAALDAGVDVNARGARRETALHLAVSRRLDEAVALLAERGAELDARNERGETPLDLALAAGDAAGSTARLLRELGATAPDGAPVAAR